MVTRYALDTDVLSMLKVAREAMLALGTLPILVTDTVWDEFTHPGGRQEELKQDAEMLRALAGTAREIAPMTPEAATFSYLERTKPQIGPGELSIISIALHAPEVVPVLIDRRALFRAVEELRGRVLSFHGFLEVLLQQHALPAREARMLSSTFLGRYHAHPPSWWSV